MKECSFKVYDGDDESIGIYDFEGLKNKVKEFYRRTSNGVPSDETCEKVFREVFKEYLDDDTDDMIDDMYELLGYQSKLW